MGTGREINYHILFRIMQRCHQQDFRIKKLLLMCLQSYHQKDDQTLLLSCGILTNSTYSTDPFTRMLAARIFVSIKDSHIFDYFFFILCRLLKDKDFLVRKTAVICALRLYETEPELFFYENSVPDLLLKSLSDPSPIVVTNTAKILYEIQVEEPKRNIFPINKTVINNLLSILSQSNEWGIINIFESLSIIFSPKNSLNCSRVLLTKKYFQEIVKRISVYLNHQNYAVVMTCIQVILKSFEYLDDTILINHILNKISISLITLLLYSTLEIQYIVLKNIKIIIQKYPTQIFKNSKYFQFFFCSSSDPTYVKLEKIDIMVLLVNSENIEDFFPEISCYLNETNPTFVSKVILSIARCAIKLEESAYYSIYKLLEIGNSTRFQYKKEKIIIAIKDIMTVYPNRFNKYISKFIIENSSIQFNDLNAKISFIWIIGELSNYMENAENIFSSLILEFSEQKNEVKLQILISTIKIFLRKPKETQNLLGNIFNLIINENNSQELIDRAVIYWRILSIDPEMAYSMTLSENSKLFKESFYVLDEILLNNLIRNISTVKSVSYDL